MIPGENAADPNAIDLEASRWLVVMESGKLPAQLQRRFEAWLAEDIRHRGAFIRAQAASVRVDRLAALAGGRSVLQIAPARATLLPGNTNRRRMMLAAAAAVAGLICSGAWLGRDWIEDTWGGTVYASNVGELRKVVLADGSVLTMNTQTQLRVLYTAERRDIRLIRGEVEFAVAHDAKRPFEVRVDGWSARALGTVFSVRRLDEVATELTVTEGLVQVSSMGRNISQPQPPLAANQQVTVGVDGRAEVRQLSTAQIAEQLAWRSHLVVFAGQPLRQALAEMNRYTRRIVVASPELAERRIVGVFSTLDPQTFVSAMQATLGVEAIESGDVVLLRNVN